MKLIFLGPPGAGKGTLAAKAVDILKLPHISTGAIFRSAIAAASPLGLKVKAIIDAGKLVDDDTTVFFFPSPNTFDKFFAPKSFIVYAVLIKGFLDDVLCGDTCVVCTWNPYG